MSFADAERLAHTLLFEGYVLYPYRRSSLKNRQRWPLGALYPPGFCALGQGDPSALQTECLVAGELPSVRVSVRFLQLGAESEPAAETERASSDGGEPWYEAIERRIDSDTLPLASLPRAPWHASVEMTCVGQAAGVDPRRLHAAVIVTATSVAPELWRLRVAVENRSPCTAPVARGAVLPQVLASTHVLLECSAGRFVSLLEPPPELQAHAAECRNVGAWPVLVGPPEQDCVMLCSPIILYDRPRIAPESPGDFFDATEIDEMLTLRVLTLTDREREEIRRSDPRGRRLLDRTEALDEGAVLRLHGAKRAPDASIPEPDRELPPGTRVRIAPRRGGDVLDLALAGELATVAKVEQDLEGQVFYAVTVDCDPGRDLGLTGQPGHRFFFKRDELEPAP